MSEDLKTQVYGNFRSEFQNIRPTLQHIFIIIFSALATIALLLFAYFKLELADKIPFWSWIVAFILLIIVIDFIVYLILKPKSVFNNIKEGDFHKMALEKFKFLFAKSIEINQTMLTPKYTPIADDLTLIKKNDQWLLGYDLKRIYGINNSIDLESAKIYLDTLDKNENAEIYLVDLTSMPSNFRGYFPNVTIGKKRKTERAILTVPKLAKNKFTNGMIELTSKQEIKFLKKYFELWLDKGNEFTSSYNELLQKIDSINKKLVEDKIVKIFNDLKKIQNIEFAAGFVGSFLNLNHQDWEHRDIDILLIIKNNIGWNIIEKMKELIKLQLNELSHSERMIHIEFKDGPIKIPPTKGVETLQFHILFDTLDNALDWPFHVKQRRRESIKWLDSSNPEMVKDLTNALQKDVESSAAINSVMNGGFGLKDCHSIFENPKYLYKEITANINGNIERTPKSSLNITDNPIESYWRDSYLTLYSVYNFCYNLGIINAVKSGQIISFQDMYEELDFVAHVLVPFLSKSEIRIFQTNLESLKTNHQNLKNEFLFPSEKMDLKEFENNLNKIKEKIKPFLKLILEKLV